MIVVLMQILIFSFHNLKYNLVKGIRLIGLIFIVILFFVITIGGFIELDLLGDLFLERLDMISDGINERKDSWISTFYVSNWIIGDGLGVYGHKAVEYSNIYIPDGYFFRLLAELGLPGFILFFIILISSIIISFLKIKYYYIEFSIITGLTLQAIGSDIFSFQLVAPIFWFTCGIVLSNPKLNNTQ